MCLPPALIVSVIAMFHVKHSAMPNHAHRHHRAIRVVINMGRLYHRPFSLACDADILPFSRALRCLSRRLHGYLTFP